MMGWVFSLLLIAGTVTCAVRGRIAEVPALMFDGAEDAVRLCLSLAGSYLFFIGLLNVARRAGLVDGLAKLMRRPLEKLMPGVGAAAGPVTLNLAANFFGLGNAATPFGLEAMRGLNPDRSPGASDAVCMFLALNASAVELLPTSVLAVRSACGSTDPNSIIVPTFVSSVFAAAAAILVCKLCEARR